MNLFFIAWGTYAGFPSAIRCASARANCPIYVVTDTPGAWLPPQVHHVDLKKFHSVNELLTRLLPGGWHDQSRIARATSLARWFVLRDCITNIGMSFPVFCSDWDIMIFDDLDKACEPFSDYDFARTVNHPNIDDTNAAYLVCRKEPLDAFCEIVATSTRTADDPEYHDMAIWREVAKQDKWLYGDLTDVVKGSTFDLGIHCSLGKYRMNGKSKLVTFRNGHPYFTIDATGEQVKAHNIHCWGEYKGREPLLLKEAKI